MNKREKEEQNLKQYRRIQPSFASVADVMPSVMAYVEENVRRKERNKNHGTGRMD